MGSEDGQFNFPAGIFVDSATRQLLVADQLNSRIQVFDLDGNFLFCFGTPGSGSGKFNTPQGVWADGQGRIYVADSFEGRIQVLDRNGDFIGYIGEFGEAPGQFRLPTDMAIDPSNRLFVASANNARLEVFGLDGFADPEGVVPAVIHIEPNPLDRANPEPAVVGYVEVPGYPVEQVVTSTIAANGVPAAVSPVSIADRDGNGVPDLRVEFDWAAFVATLPPEGPAAIAVTGSLGDGSFEGSDLIQVITTGACGPGTPACPLGGADPQCNEAVCIEPNGCGVQPKADDTPCDDGDACTIDDTCSTGACVGGRPSNCDDINVCTDDSCEPARGCVHTDNAAACDDTNACTSADTCSNGTCTGGPLYNCDDGNTCTDDSCDPALGCVHTNNMGPCDDRDPGTVQDVCDAAARCLGHTVTANYAILRWPPAPAPEVPLDLNLGVHVQGNICGDIIDVGQFSRVDGDAVALESDGRAMALHRMSTVAGDLITGGGSVRLLANVTVGGRVDSSGAAAELDECFAASYRASTRWTDFAGPAASSGLTLGSLHVASRASQRVPAEGTLGTGQIVIDATDIVLGAFATLTLVGGPTTEEVIVRVREPRAVMVVGYSARIETDGLPPERVIFAVDGPVVLRAYATLSGTVLATQSIRLGRASTIGGAVLSRADIRLEPYATVDLHPFAGW
jgi:hypothetical protein